MRKSRVKSPVVNNSRGQLGKICSNSPHLFFMTHIFVTLPLISYPDLALSQAVGDLGTRLPIPFSLSLPCSRFLDVTHKNGCEGDYFSLTLSIIYEYHFLLQRELHCSCLKSLVLSNVVQGGSLSTSMQDYNCSLKNPALMDTILWSSVLQSVTLIIFCTCPPHPQSIKLYQQRLRLYG